MRVVTPRNLIMRAMLALVVFFVLLACGGWQSLAAIPEHEHPVPEKLGNVQFATSCSPKLQKSFERAVALLHSFAYSAAEKAFRDVAAKDPNCAAPHWGVAMTYFHQLWEPPLAPQNIARGLAEIEQAKKLSSSDRERGFIEALSLIYAKADSVPYQERLNRYVEAMRKLAGRYRDDAECQIFYALALIAAAPPSDASPSIAPIVLAQLRKPMRANGTAVRHLTNREREVLKLIGEGATTKDVAQRLGISAKTAQVHRENVKQKLDLRSTAAMVRYAIKHKLIRID